MNGSQPWIISTRGLYRSYGDVVALRPIDLRVAGHSIFGFLGPNGAGKTTTIKLLLGLVRPSGGSGEVFGLDIVQDSLDIRTRIGYLAQNPRFYDYMTARETLQFKARFYYSGPEAGIEARVTETLRLVGLSDRADRPISGFSGGERQRLGIAQAQISYPDLLILDEPAANLDPLGRRDVLEVMERLRKYATVFYSTHILDDVQQVSDSVAILDRGQLVAQAPLQELLAGKEGTVYSLLLVGDPREAQARVSDLDWVSSVRARHSNGRTAWRVSVVDEEAAESQLLRTVLADSKSIVLEFGRKTYDLEEVFVNMVQGPGSAATRGGNNGKR